MLVATDPTSTVWRTWPDIVRERIRLDRELLAEKRTALVARLDAAQVSPESRAAALADADAISVRLDDEDADVCRGEACLAPTDVPSFELGHISWLVRSKVRALAARGTVEDHLAGVELLVRHGVRAHKDFRDAAGREIPCQHEARGDSRLVPPFPVLSSGTFEVYAASGIAEALARIVVALNNLGEAHRKN
jgi:hypothetical protein